MKLCTVTNCNKAAKARGYCSAHWARWRKNGSPGGAIKAPIVGCLVGGCGLGHHAKGYCSEHYSLLVRNGHPENRQRTRRGAKLSWLIAHSKFDGDDCLMFPFPGHEAVPYKGRAHRVGNVMLRIVGGNPTFEKAECAHSCGNGHLGCANPKHLRWATSKENHFDQVVHCTRVRGINHPIAKLSSMDVIWIRELYSIGAKRMSDLAEMFQVSQTQISGIINRKEWRWM